MGRVDYSRLEQRWRQWLASYLLYIIVGMFLLAAFISPLGGSFIQHIMAKVLIFGIFAMSLNFIFGYAGLFSLGHAIFFGLGGYAAGIFIVKYGITSFWLVTPAAMLTSMVTAAFIGFIVLRLHGIYFLLITLAFGELFVNAAFQWRSMTGGSDGLTQIPYPDLGLPGFNMGAMSFYYLVFAIFIIFLLVSYRVVNSSFGLALQGIREDEQRMKHLGYNTWLYKYVAFIISGAFAGLAGVLFAHNNSFIMPGNLGVLTSTMAMLMIILGSDRVVFGPALGAAVIVLLEFYSSLYLPERWPLILGGAFVLSVMFLRGGMSIYIVKLSNKIRNNILGYSYGSVED